MLYTFALNRNEVNPAKKIVEIANNLEIVSNYSGWNTIDKPLGRYPACIPNG